MLAPLPKSAKVTAACCRSDPMWRHLASLALLLSGLSPTSLTKHCHIYDMALP
jgi:hypothetical protein